MIQSIGKSKHRMIAYKALNQTAIPLRSITAGKLGG